MTTGRRVASARSLVAQSDLPSHEAIRLMEAASGRARESLIASDDVGADVADHFGSLATRRRRGEPLQYLEGTAQFGPIEVAVDPRVLIPRPETEQLWELVVAALQASPPRVVVDLGTGSGNLAIALKHAFPLATVHAVDVSAAALEAARANIAASGLVVEVHRGNLFDALPETMRGTIDLVISNPPYVATAQHQELPIDVRDHEPAIALFAGDDGLSVLKRIIAEAPRWLTDGGLLACEIGSDQGAAVAALAAGLDSRIVKDLSQRDRFLLARKEEM